MIFEHEETGLRVAVLKEDDVLECITSDGAAHNVVTGTRLITEGRQAAYPWGPDDVHQLLQVAVNTSRGRIKMVRVE